MIIRPAVDDDYDAYLRLYAELQVPGAPPSRESFVATMKGDVLVGVVSVVGGAGGAGVDVVAGVIWARPRGPFFHVVHLISDPQHRRTGVGRALLIAAAARAQDAGFSSWMLTVKPENTAARALYASVGMREVFAATLVRVRSVDVDALAGDDDSAIVVDALADDVDGAFGIAHGELAAIRSVPGRSASAARDVSGALVGVACFDPRVPGFMIFRVARRSFARPFLRGLRSAYPDVDVVHVYVEDDAALADALVACGGEVAMRTLRMEGPIPSM